ncbi:MAG: hypothetical protein MZV63_34540 [Marinilabiliales bacterium]|nr:hypothetical protein [Marinilabiliales bacterium]
MAYRFDDLRPLLRGRHHLERRPLPPLSVQKSIGYGRAGVFTEASLAVSPVLTATFGVRCDYSGMSEEASLSPRGAVSLLVGEGQYDNRLRRPLPAGAAG